MYLRRSHKSVCFRVGVVPPSEVPVIAGHNGVLVSLLNVLTVPLSNAWTTGIGQYHPPYVLEGLVLCVCVHVWGMGV